MFCLFQLNGKIKNAILFLLTAVFVIPLSGALFAPEWGLDGERADTGRIRKITEHFPQGDVVHIFDNQNRKILRTFPDEKSRKKVENKMTYSSTGELEKVEIFIDGKLICTETAVYDGGVLRRIIRNGASEKDFLATTMLVYDEKTSRLKMYGIQTPQGVIDYFYDRNPAGQVVYIRGFFKGKFNAGARYKYDSAGYITEVSRFNSRMQNAGILKNEWKLDKKGNWIEKKSSLYKKINEKPIFVEIVKRTVEYAE